MTSRLERSINTLLQQKINFVVNGKTIKSGKLILFCIKDFYLVFTLSINHTKKIFEIPYPYGFTLVNNRVILDYTVNKLSHNIKHIEKSAKNLISKKPNKFFNTTAEIFVMEEIHTPHK